MGFYKTFIILVCMQNKCHVDTFMLTGAKIPWLIICFICSIEFLIDGECKTRVTMCSFVMISIIFPCQNHHSQFIFSWHFFTSKSFNRLSLICKLERVIKYSYRLHWCVLFLVAFIIMVYGLYRFQRTNNILFWIERIYTYTTLSNLYNWVIYEIISLARFRDN